MMIITPIKVNTIAIERVEVIGFNFKNFERKSPVILKIKSFQASAMRNPTAAAKASLSCFLNSLLKLAILN